MSESQLLNEASRRLVELGLIGSGAHRWETIGTKDLVRSTVREMVVVASGGPPVRVYHKRIKPRDGSTKAQIYAAELRETLLVTMDMEERLSAHLPHPEMQIARTLGVDVDELETVTLAVPGNEFGSLWRRSLTPSRRVEAHRAVSLVGRVIRLMELHCRYLGGLSERLVGEEVVDRRVARIEPFFDEREVSAIAEAMTGLEREAMEMQAPIVRVHGDLNATNVLVHRSGIGLIDFAWQARLRLTDLAHFAFRLEYESGSRPRFARSLVESLLDGYGDRQVATTPAWRFLRYSKLLRVIGSGSRSLDPRVRWRVGRARRELERELGISSR